MEVTDDLVKELFKNEQFKQEMKQLIKDNLVVQYDYNVCMRAYVPVIMFMDEQIEIQSKNNGH